MIEFGQIGSFDRVCSPRALIAVVWRRGGQLVYLVVRVPWYVRREVSSLDVDGPQVVPPGWCWRACCLRMRWQWPTFKRTGWLDP